MRVVLTYLDFKAHTPVLAGADYSIIAAPPQIPMRPRDMVFHYDAFAIPFGVIGFRLYAEEFVSPVGADGFDNTRLVSLADFQQELRTWRLPVLMPGSLVELRVRNMGAWPAAFGGAKLIAEQML